MSHVLIHIGFPKSGSTYLQKWFEEHPEIYYQPKYIAQGFYHAGELARYLQLTEKVAQNFVLSSEDITLWGGNPNLYGLRRLEPYNYRKFQNRMCETLYTIYPTSKVLIVTRGYLSIFTSIYAQYIRIGGTLSYTELFQYNEQLFTTSLDYSYVIDLYRKKFGIENVIILPYELLLEKPVMFLSMIEKRLDIKEKFDLAIGKVNASLSNKELSTYYNISCLVFRLLKPFSKNMQIRMYLHYTNFIRTKKAQSFLKWISGFISEPLVMNEESDIILLMKGKAEILRDEELYGQYLKEYLIELK